MPIPNFFIVGSPKCGTSSLYHHIRQHPDVFMATPKELNYFASDLTSSDWCHEEDWYLSHFDEAGDESAIGEASVWYLFSNIAAREIAKLSPSAKIIALFRNPAEMIYSYHGQRLWNGTEDVADFTQALDLIAERKHGRSLPKNPNPVDTLDYLSIANYGTQLQRYYDVFPRENVLPLVFEEYVRNPGKYYEKVFDFLGIDNTFEPNHDDSNTVRNTNKKIKRRWLGDLLEQPPAILLNMGKFLLPKKEWRTSLWRSVRRSNIEWRSRPPLSPELRAELDSHFSDEVERLGQLMNKDLVEIWYPQRHRETAAAG